MQFFNRLRLKHRALRKRYKSARRGETELRLLEHLVNGGTALDIGANKGVYCYFLSRFADRVIAFEPNPQLQKILRGYGLPNIEIRGKALSNATGEATLSIPLSPSGTRRNNVATLNSIDEDADMLTVPVSRVDDEACEDVRFIKIDVEGHELAVLEGAEQTIEKYRPIILLEVNDGVESDIGQRTLGFLTDRGYVAFQHFDGVIRHVSTLGEQRLGIDRNYIMFPTEKA